MENALTSLTGNCRTHAAAFSFFVNNLLGLHFLPLSGKVAKKGKPFSYDGHLTLSFKIGEKGKEKVVCIEPTSSRPLNPSDKAPPPHATAATRQKRETNIGFRFRVIHSNRDKKHIFDCLKVPITKACTCPGGEEIDITALADGEIKHKTLSLGKPDSKELKEQYEFSLSQKLFELFKNSVEGLNKKLIIEKIHTTIKIKPTQFENDNLEFLNIFTEPKTGKPTLSLLNPPEKILDYFFEKTATLFRDAVQTPPAQYQSSIENAIKTMALNSLTQKSEIEIIRRKIETIPPHNKEHNLSLYFMVPFIEDLLKLKQDIQTQHNIDIVAEYLVLMQKKMLILEKEKIVTLMRREGEPEVALRYGTDEAVLQKIREKHNLDDPS